MILFEYQHSSDRSSRASSRESHRSSNRFRSPSHNNGMKCKAPYYTGKQSWDAYWLQFQMVAQRGDWSQEEQKYQLGLALKEEALEFWSELSDFKRDSLYDIVHLSLKVSTTCVEIGTDGVTITSTTPVDSI